MHLTAMTISDKCCSTIVGKKLESVIHASLTLLCAISWSLQAPDVATYMAIYTVT